MKVTKKSKDKKKDKISAVTKKKSHSNRKEQVLVVAQEIKYARLLSGNEKKTRDRVLKSLKKWLTNCFEKGYEFKEEDFTRVWKGLFYAVWMSDKPLIQEELCDSIAGILDLFPAEELKHALLMAKAGFKVLATEWYGLDQHRMDKFLMLVRRYLRGSLRCLSRCDWSVASCEKYSKMLSGNDGLFALKTPHYARNASSMLLHIVDCFLEELAKVSGGDIPDESVSALLKPFTTYTCLGEAASLCAATRRLLTALLRQSEPGLRLAGRTSAWRRMGCPEGGPDALELASDDEEHPEGEENGDAGSDDESNYGSERPLDPRAGRVDVELPLLPVPATLIAETLRGLLGKSTSKAHKRIKICFQRFDKLASGEYPLQVEAPDTHGVVVLKRKRSERALRALDAKLKSDTDELKLRGLSRKHRKRLLRKTRLGQSIVEDMETVHKTHRKIPRNGEWLVESTATAEEKDTSNKENQNKKKVNKLKNKLQKRKQDTQNGDSTQNGDAKKIKLDNKKPKKDKVTDIPNKKAKEVKLQKKIKEKDSNKQLKVVQKVIPNKVKPITEEHNKKPEQKVETPKFLVKRLRNFSKQLQKERKQDKNDGKELTETAEAFDTPKKVKFVLKNNSMQKPVDYYKSVRQSPSIPFDSSKKPNKTNLKPSTPSPINPFFKKSKSKLRSRY